jgi:hypothetical protein
MSGGPGYWDENDKWVEHDPNYHTFYYTCSAGHSFTTVTYGGRTWFGGKFTPEEDKVYID